MQEIVDRLTADDRGAQIARTLVYPYLNHAATMYESGYATKDDIDASMRFGCGYPVGPLALVDALGASTVVEGLRAQHATTGDPLHEPAPVLVKLAEAGETVRVYIPYGTEWYGYLMRRLAEKPSNLSFFLKSLISKS